MTKRQKTKTKPILKSDTESEWTTGNVSEFYDGDAIMRVAHQMDQRGMHRIALVDEFHDVITAGYGSIYEHPCFATFGVHQFMGMSDAFKGDVLLTETVYLVQLGRHSHPRSKEKKLRAVWTGWYIEKVTAEKYGDDMVELAVSLRHTDGETIDIEEMLSPDVGEIEEIRVEEYGGSGKDQQSIVLIVNSSEIEGDENPNPIVVNTQVEIDYRDGTFMNLGSLEWERI